MATVPQITSQIRFAIEQLSTRNAHHEFEHMCRRIARQRICTNILPATGPVAAGGDQGRDFETFRTYLNESPLANSSFVGRSSAGPLVFACTLQRDQISTKVKSDVTTITSSGIAVDAVYIFLANDLAVSRRHQLQEWAQQKHDVHLEIIDAQGISEILCDIEIFWIAEQYLSIPREFRPKHEPEDVDAWYRTALDRWSEDREFTPNPANFHELVSAVRHATFSDRAKSDLPLWISRLHEFRTHEHCDSTLKSRALYEIAVALLRGLGTLHGLEAELRAYFTRVNELELPADLEDAGVLIAFCRGAFYNDAVGLTPSEIDAISDSVRNRLEERLVASETAITRCAILHTLGHLSMSLAGTVEKPAPPDTRQAAKFWSKMLDLVNKAPIYPLELFADRVTKIIELLGDSSEFDTITNKLDDLLSKRFGGFTAAEKCRDRAVVLYRKGHVLRAIKELHRAKIAWYADETLKASILTMLSLSEWYLELGLSFAAKQYAMAAALITTHTDKTELKQYIPVSFMEAAKCAYSQGCWCDYLGLVDSGMRSHNLVPNQYEDEDRANSEVQQIVFHTAIVMMVEERYAPEISSEFKAFTDTWPYGEMIDQAVAQARDTWSNKGNEALWSDLEAQMYGRPFCDVGMRRTVTWKQLGLTWNVSWQNNYHLTALAEQFIATAQILMAEWASMDLCLLRTQIQVQICKANIIKPKVEPLASNSGRYWQVTLPEKRDAVLLADLQQEAFANVLTIIAEVSLLPQPEFKERLEKTFKEGIAAKVHVARPYEHLYRNCIPKPRPFEDSRRAWKLPEIGREFRIRQHKDMAWFDGPGPGYSQEDADEQLRNRYKRSVVPIKHTLKRLAQDKQFMSVVKKLRNKGWLDWHILTAIANIAVSYRVNTWVQQQRRTEEEIQKKVRLVMCSEEPMDAAPVPVRKFSEEAMRLALRTSQVSTLQNNNLDCHQQTPDFGAIDDFLRHRFNYWTDDVEHENPLPSMDEFDTLIGEARKQARKASLNPSDI